MKGLTKLTLEQIKQSGNRIVNQDNSDWTMTTKYGKATYNYWKSDDEGKTYVNYDCKTIY